MSHRLLIRFLDGRTDERTLSRSQPLTIGKLAFNDLCIPEPIVGPLHCRISWNKTAYEVVAATSSGVSVNGLMKSSAVLQPNDVLVVGSCELTYVSNESPARPEKGLRFAAATEESLEPLEQLPNLSSPRPADRISPPPLPPSALPQSSPQKAPLPQAPVVSAKAAARPAPAKVVAPVKMEPLDDDISFSELPELPTERPPARALGVEPTAPVAPVALPTRQRPGEQDVLRSPLVVGLSAGVLALLLIAGTVWFLMARQNASRLFDQAQVELDNGRFDPAIELYQQFIEAYPTDDRTPIARANRERAVLRRLVSSGGPIWKEALTTAQNFVRDFQTLDGFPEWQIELRSLSEEIALGAAKAAEVTQQRDWLETVSGAQSLLQRQSAPEQPPLVALQRIADAVLRAEDAIRRAETLTAALTEIRTALGQADPVAAFAVRSRLLGRYPELKTNKELGIEFDRTLAAEMSVVINETTPLAPLPIDEPSPVANPTTTQTSGSWSPVLLTRVRTDEPRSGRCVAALARGMLQAIDSGNGEPLWQQQIGEGSRFFPQEVHLERPQWLLHEPLRQVLSLRDCHTGKLVWQQGLASPPSGPPLVTQGQVYLTTEGGELLKFNLADGVRTTRIVLSQPLVGPPLMSRDGQSLYVAGRAALLYAFTRRPLEPVCVTYTGHVAGSVPVALTGLGRMGLLMENQAANQTRLRLWWLENPHETLPEVGTPLSIAGPVIDPPALRGAQLVIASVGEKLTALQASDDESDRGLKLTGNYQIPGGYGGTCSVLLGPDDQLWMAGSAFRRFEVTADSIRLDPVSAATGLTVQPLQQEAGRFILGRKSRFHAGLIVSPIQDERMTSPWRLVAGSLPLVWSASSASLFVTDGGAVWNLPPAGSIQNGLYVRSAAELDVPAGQVAPLCGTTLATGKLVIAAPEENSTFWWLTETGTVQQKQTLPGRLQAELSSRTLVPLENGVVGALANGQRLRWWPAPGIMNGTPAAGQTLAVQDLIKADAAPDDAWHGLWSLDAEGVLASHGSGRFSRVEIRTGEVPHLAETAGIDWPAAVGAALAISSDSLWIGDRTGKLQRLSPQTFEALGTRSWEEPLAQAASLPEGALVVTQTGLVTCVNRDAGLTTRWQHNLAAGERPVGAIHISAAHVSWALQTGKVITWDQQTGQLVGEWASGKPTTIGLVTLRNETFLVSSDGQWQPIPPPAGTTINQGRIDPASEPAP